MPNWPLRLVPVVMLGAGCLGLLKIGRQVDTPLQGELSALPRSILGMTAIDQVVSEAEQRVAGMDAYLMRLYARDTSQVLSLYVGYYQAQTQGKSIHSPKNCLPGAGWEPVESRPETVQVGDTPVTVNRYVLEKGTQRAIVYYWYQGRGRTSWNEYAVKWELLRDKARYGRSDEALVRIVVPVTPAAPGAADSLAAEAVRVVVPALNTVLAPLPGPRPERASGS